MLLTVHQVAELLQISEATVRRMEEEGRLKSHAQGQYRFDMAEVMKTKSGASRAIKNKTTIENIDLKKLKSHVDTCIEKGVETATLVLEDVSVLHESAIKHNFITVGLWGKGYGTTWMN
jgi:excisionase family DNA binding protein